MFNGAAHITALERIRTILLLAVLLLLLICCLRRALCARRFYGALLLVLFSSFGLWLLEFLPGDSGFRGTVNGFVEVRFMKDAKKEWWGTEHMPIMVHAAKVAKEKGEQCVVVEAGAHRGAVALVAAKLGCEVYAFEKKKDHCNAMVANMQLNKILTDQMHIFNMAIGDQDGHRIDEQVPDAKHITILKMDIDGPDVLAMRGASKLFSSGGVDFVNLEFAPEKHKKIANVSDTQYLVEMDALGFDVYLLDCFPTKTINDPRIKAHVGAHCLVINRKSNSGQQEYEEPAIQKMFLQCVMEGECDPSNKAVYDAQRIPKENFSIFTEALGKAEVNLILRKRQ